MSETLYASATTRVYRLGQPSAPDSLICKEYLGPLAAQRLHHEKDMLVRLGGIEGVVQLALGPHRADVLFLRDCGESPLAQVLHTGKCDTATLLTLAVRLARTLVAVHRAGVIHRDINPANIVLSKAGEPVLIDFDLAVLAEQEMAVEQQDRIVGTLGYLAPEQTGRTGRTVDQRADLHALGATLYEMATGRPPFEGKDTLQLIHDHLVCEAVSPSQLDPHVPRGLSNVILRLLAKEPEQRYQSAEGLLHDLQRLRGELEHEGDGVFELGERDFSAQLSAPSRLVGRNAELVMLRAALADAMHTTRRTVLIEGPAGVGKSALINEFRPDVAEKGGWFVQGKFDQYQKEGATAGAVTQALRALGRLLLAQPRDELAAQRRRILDALGANAGPATRLPEFALLLGAHPEVREVDPRQAELQLLQVTVDLLGAIASPGRPLVIVLDDLQWAGTLSLRVFERLMNEPGLQGLLLVGALRADEVDASHVLSPILAQWRQEPQPPMQIALANLTLANMGELTAQMLRLAPEPAADLAEAVNALTGGNPFDTVELINALRRDGILSLGERGWQWDRIKVRRFVGRGNVVDLLAARIGRLPAPSRELLEFMVCLGNAVECKLLCAAVGLSDSVLRQRLRAPLEDGLLLADQIGGQDSVQFRHDRVQQVVLATMDDVTRGQRQLGMARRLANAPGFEDEAAQQYLACVSLLQAQNESEEQRRAAQLFYGLAQKLAGRAIYLLAERYLAAAHALLTAADDPGDAARLGAIEVDRHAALYSLGRLDESDRLYEAMQARITDPVDRVEPACLQIRSLFMRAQMTEAMELGLRLLEQLGLDVPAGHPALDTERRLDALGVWIRQESRPDRPRRPMLEDPRLLAKAKLLARTTWAANYRSDLKAFVWLLLENQRMWIENGPCADLVVSLSRLSNMLVSERQDFRAGYTIARHVLAEGEAQGCEPQTSEARAIFTMYACHWFEPLERALDHNTRAYEVVRARGDVSYACYLHNQSLAGLLDVAPTLDIIEAKLEAGLVMCQRYGNNHAAALNRGERELLRALRGNTRVAGVFDEERFDDPAFVAHLEESHYVGHTYYVRRALCALIFGDLAALGRHSANAMSMLRTISGYYTASHTHLGIALSRAWQLQRLQQRQGKPAGIAAAALRGELESSRTWLADRASDQPYNFLHLLRLVEAEQAWALGDLWKAATTFDAAVLEAERRERPWQRALITERAGLFHVAAGLAGTGRFLLARARDHYQAWGATAKVDQMQRDHVFLQTATPVQSLDPLSGIATSQSVRGGSGAVSSDGLDLVGVLRASQALSSETSLDQLTARVTEVLASLSGATKVLVLSWNDGQWWLQPPALGEPSISMAQAAEHGLLPTSVFGYAERTGEVLVVDDAPSDDRFARDPYFVGVPVCSLLLVPIAGQGASRGMLLLENRLGRAAFNAQRLDAVMLIAGQLAVSLANAQLYQSLEQRVQARTRELQETQAQLVATARRAGMAEIANNVLHNVGNVLNSINVSASVLRGTIGNSRIGGLTRAVDLINEHEHDLPHFIETDPRGKALWPYLNELVGALHSEQQEALKDLDRLSLSVDHITYVVATQQSHAGPSSVREMARPHALVEEALLLSAEAIDSGKVAIVRRFEEVPASALDKQRLVQILVNLIGNAAQAMRSVPAETRQLTLGTSLMQGAGGKRLRITVQDAGEGIAPENLTRIFSHGFTTRQGGHGFGLHSSALAAAEMGGRLTVHSDGAGRGAIFTIDLPIRV